MSTISASVDNSSNNNNTHIPASTSAAAATTTARTSVDPSLSTALLSPSTTQQQQQSTENNNTGSSTTSSTSSISATALDNNTSNKQRTEMLADEDPLLISQSLTYVTDDGSILHSFMAAPFSFGFKIQMIVLEVFLIFIMIAAVPIGAHGTVVGICIANLILLAWFWYNLVRSVDVTSDGTLRFWIGNIEVDVPFDKIVSIRRVGNPTLPCCGGTICIISQPYRGFLSEPSDGVAIVTTVPSTPFWLWPRSAGKPERTCCCGICSCPRLTVVFSPMGGSLPFIRDVENEMRNNSTTNTNPQHHHNYPKQQYPSNQTNTRNAVGATTTNATKPSHPDYLDV